MTEEKLAEIKSHVQPFDRTCFDVRRAFEDRDALIAEVERLRGWLQTIAGGLEVDHPTDLARIALQPST